MLSDRNGNGSALFHLPSTSKKRTMTADNGYEGLSSDYEPFARQVAGHTLTMNDEVVDPSNAYKLRKQAESCSSNQMVMSLGVLRHRRTGHVLKPAQKMPRGEREIAFFSALFSRRMTSTNGDAEPELDANGNEQSADRRYSEDGLIVTKDPMLRKLADFVPKFYGSRMVNIFENGYMFLEMEDITARFRRPCILDVKIGAVTWDPEASADKVKYERCKYPLGKEVGFRILGLHAVNDDGSLLVRDKHYSKTMTEAMIVPTLEDYLGNRPKAYRNRILKQFVKRLNLIAAWIEEQRLFTFYSTSILLVFEGDHMTVSPEVRSKTVDMQLTDARMIDFTHVFDAEGKRDHNYADGLASFIKYVKKVDKKVAAE